MGKKILGILVCLCTVLTMPAYALSINLSLFSGGLSVLDGLFLIGAGLALIGVLLICIALLKKDKEIEENEDIEEEPDMEEVPLEESREEELSEEDTEEPMEAVIPVEEPEAEPEPEEIAGEDEEEIEAEDETVYPTLTLTGMNHVDFKILPLKQSVSLGRRQGNDLIFDDTTISGIHCEILVEEDQVFVLDKDSTNGTYVNRKKIIEKTELHKGDILTLGKMEFKVSF